MKEKNNFLTSIITPYLETFNLIKKYWGYYGKLKAFTTSPFLHFSILITLIITITSSNSCDASPYWSQISLTTIPNILGFTLGGFAIWLGFGDKNFQEILFETNFNGISASFLHFIIVQSLTLIVAIFTLGMKCNWVAQAISLFFLTYSIMIAIATGLAIFRISTWYSLFVKTKTKPQKENNPPK